MCVIVGLAVFVVAHRSHKSIRASSFQFFLLSLSGLGLLVAAVPALAVADWLNSHLESRTTACRVAPLLVSLGLVIVLGSVSARNFLVWRIFDNSQLKERKLTQRHLLRVVGVLVVVHAVIAGSLLHAIGVSRTTQWCTVDLSHTAATALVVCNVLLLVGLVVWALFVTVKIRNVPSDFNESSHLAWATYNLLTFGTAMVAVGGVASDSEVRLLALTLTLLTSVLSFVGFVYAPKVLNVLVVPRERSKIFARMVMFRSSRKILS
eukprot:c12737_g1_i1.p1 GENE.c12737_g1_i1~~c12737_g1_i1.p1  ORF type:complete len:264 (-),score=87.44 c12737_g1_i1:385-1176(-)